LFSLCGQKPRYVRIPIKILKLIIIIFRLAGSISKRAAQKSEYARIGLYYATESMLVWDDKLNKYDEEATPETGHETLFNFYAREIGKS
jgi:divinyl chlorophyllide a 8-vinyl-reductase